MDLQPLSGIEYIMLVEILFQQVLVLLICLFMASHSHSLRKRCRNRREVRYRMSVQVPKIISHLHYIINDNGSVCIDKLRMDRNAFHTLVLLTKDIGGLTDSKSMSSSEKLAMFLNILAHYEKNRSIKVDYIRLGWSVSQAFNECLSAILKLTPLLLVNPKSVLEGEIEDRWKWFEVELCANGWRGDNGTFRPGHLMELERYIHKYHLRSGLKGEPHIKNKMRYWKRCYGSIALLKTRSGLRFQYSDGTIIVDDPKHWIDFIKIDPQAKKMKTKKWPLFEDWEEIFGPLDATEAIQKSQAQQHSNDMSLGFAIDVDLDDDDGEENAYHSSKVSTKKAENVTGQGGFATAEDFIEPSSFTGDENVTGPSVFNEGENVVGSEYEHAGSRKNKSKKRKKIVEDDSETFLKGMMEVMKNFTESQDKRIGSLIEKMGNRDDLMFVVKFILSLNPMYLSCTPHIKTAMILCKDDKIMELFLRMGEPDRSVGKTTTKTMVALALESVGTIYYSLGNCNNKIGVVLSLIGMSRDVGFGVLEMGMNKKGEILELFRMCRPDVRVILNVNAAHLENFANLEEVSMAK
ncbi:hypothetical protein H5410_037413 [Solanum commersonii]|uniref:Uncharacterized protein n=1 Tax=Solanum commersonii TaxID=4109 RepID=A0A9J5Y7S0_SOLCO|nr:hypothetical protein H5410_037413 [Solanum commersonii]